MICSILLSALTHSYGHLSEAHRNAEGPDSIQMSIWFPRPSECTPDRLCPSRGGAPDRNKRNCSSPLSRTTRARIFSGRVQGHCRRFAPAPGKTPNPPPEQQRKISAWTSSLENNQNLDKSFNDSLDSLKCDLVGRPSLETAF